MRYGPDNPHPLSTRRTELVWEGKYDEYGNRREVDVAGCALPMQRIETIDEPRSEAAAAGQLGLPRSCLDFAVNDPTKLGGLFDQVRLNFGISGGPELLDRTLAERQLRLWITGVSRLGSWG
jgi:hypothetical protein